MFAPAVRRQHPLGQNGRRWGPLAWRRWAGCVLVTALCWVALPLRAQGVELSSLQVERVEGSLNLAFAARVTLTKAAEDALQRGVPIYFLAEAQVLRSRWYWRDERVARAQRSWRVAYQPLTGTWRVGLGGLNQTFPSLTEALAVASRSAAWKLTDQAPVDNDKNLYVVFSYRLDSSQLPGPMQFGLGGSGDFAVGVERVLRVEP